MRDPGLWIARLWRKSSTSRRATEGVLQRPGPFPTFAIRDSTARCTYSRPSLGVVPTLVPALYAFSHPAPAIDSRKCLQMRRVALETANRAEGSPLERRWCISSRKAVAPTLADQDTGY